MAISADMTFWINTLIFNKLAGICPSLILNGADRKIYDICIKDFRNFMSYLNTNHLKIEDNSGQELSPIDDYVRMIISGDMGLYQNLQDTKEVTEFIDMWVNWWWGKWQQRTKVILNNRDMPKTIVFGGFSFNSLTPEEYGELMGILVNKLIQYGEICCTQIIADSLLKKALVDMRSVSTQDKLQLIGKLQRQAKEVSYVHGPLVFIFTDNYFKLREWRSDGANTIV